MSPTNLRRTVLGILVALGLTLSSAAPLGWPLTLVVLLAVVLVAIGYSLAIGELWYDRAAVEAQRQALDAEWRALDQTRRVRSVFLSARRAMQAEAQRRWPSGPGGV